jgi:hypothetical protein
LRLGVGYRSLSTRIPLFIIVRNTASSMRALMSDFRSGHGYVGVLVH